MCDMISLPAFEALGGGPHIGPCRCVAHYDSLMVGERRIVGKCRMIHQQSIMERRK